MKKKQQKGVVVLKSVLSPDFSPVIFNVYDVLAHGVELVDS